MAELVVDVLTRVQAKLGTLSPLLVELLNMPDEQRQAEHLRDVGQHLASLSAECLARAAELDGRAVDPPARVIIDADAFPKVD